MKPQPNTPAAHTPGEWRISKHATPAHSPQFGIYAGEQSQDLATVKGANAAADAALIAAAPDMLVALRMAQWLLEPENEERASMDDYARGHRFIRAAIEKATP